MAEFVQFPVDDNTSITVEVETEPGGFAPASVDGLVWAQQTFSQAMQQARQAAEVAAEQFRKMAHRPDDIEIVLGVKLSASAGVIIAKTTTDANVTVKLVWRSGAKPASGEPEAE